MDLIAESGSTRTEWALVENGQLIENTFTEGINPFFQTRREISRCVRLSLPEIYFKQKLKQIYYYGAGCTTEEKKGILSASLVAQFKTPIEVESDLLGAARGLFNNEPGIACILGTGSNSCFYDGKNIVKNVKSGGYVLGDEGSGATLGRYFLSDLLKGLVPKELENEFEEKFRINTDQIMDQIYNYPFPSKFLATISYFLVDHTNNDYVHNLIITNLERFFNRCIAQYDYNNYPVRFVGSYAYTYSTFLQEVAATHNVKVDRIEETAMPGLIKYYSI